jgi:drug/metabolite transporter (DMT)-like permease
MAKHSIEATASDSNRRNATAASGQVPFRGFLFAILATALWSGNLLVARIFKASIPPISLGFMRWLVAFLVFSPFALKGAIRERAALKQHWVYVVTTGFLGVSLFNTLVYYAGRSTTALKMSLISITFPVMIIVISRILFGEKISLRRTLGMVVVVAGLVLLITGGSLSDLAEMDFAPGDLFMLAAATVFAVYSIMVRNRPKAISLQTFQYATFGVGVAFLGLGFVPERIMSPALVLGPGALAAIMYVGIGSSLIAFVSWNKAIELIGASRAGIVYYSQPVFAGVLAYLFLGEAVGLTHAIAACLILVGIVVASSGR